jgi:hypothetical protein
LFGVVIEEGFSQMSGRRRSGTGRGVVTAFLALGCCLLAAPAVHADFDDLLDTVLGAANATDVDLGAFPGDAGDLGNLGDLGVLQDPLGQLDQLFHDTPGSADGTSDAPVGATPDTHTDGTPDGTGSAEHDSDSGSSNHLPSVPKFSLPSNGSGGSGGGPGGSGGSGSPAGGGAKTKANTSATPAAVPAP